MGSKAKKSKKELLQERQDRNAEKIRERLELAETEKIRELQAEEDFIKYLNRLVYFTKKYTVIVVSRDTPCGPHYTTEMDALRFKLGFRTALYDKFRCSHVGVIDEGHLTCEMYKADEIIDLEFEAGGSKIHLSSGGLNSKNTCCDITVDGENYDATARGLGFAVFDKSTKTVIDAVSFDTYAGLKCTRKDALAEKISDYVAAHPDIHIMGFCFPWFPSENLSENEKYIADNNIRRAALLDENLPPRPDSVLRDIFGDWCGSRQDIAEVITAPQSYHDKNGVRHFFDVTSKNVNTSGGVRVTAGVPREHKRSIFFAGGCQTYGIGTDDSGTVASQLQLLLNERVPEKQIAVYNYGYCLEELDSKSYEFITILNALPTQASDIVITDRYIPERPFADTSQLSKCPHNYGELFWDNAHVTGAALKLTAQEIFKKLEELSFFGDGDNSMRNNPTPPCLIVIYPRYLTKKPKTSLRSTKRELRRLMPIALTVKAARARRL